MGQKGDYSRDQIHISTGPLYSNKCHRTWDKLHINTIPTGDTPYSDMDSAVEYKTISVHNPIYTDSHKYHEQINRKLSKDGTQKETLG